MRQVLAQGVEWQYAATNAARAVPMPPLDGDSMHPFESWDEVRAVADAIAPTYRALVLFACATGLRPQEWQALQWNDVDTGHRNVTIRRSVQDGKIVEGVAKTRASLRTVLLPREALDALTGLPTPIDRTRLLFPDPAGALISLTSFSGRETKPGPWRKALTDAGIEYRAPKQMRHTYATLALAAGVPIEALSRQMGHSDIATTLRHYARFSPHVDDRYLATLDAFAARSAETGRKRDGSETAQ